LKKTENGTPGDGINMLRRDTISPGELGTTIAGSYSSVVSVSGFQTARKDLRELELLSCWRKLPTEEQEIILDIVRGLLARI
jgi:hypothetical protein